MSGIFGFIGSQGRDDASALAQAMAKAMSHRPWFQVDHYVDPGGRYALGRIGIGIFNPEPQPVWNGRRTRMLTLAGELYSTPPVAEGMSHARRALDMYERHGIGFVSLLNGVFVLGILDLEQRMLIIANDRFGHYPLFYSTHGGSLRFAPEMKGVLCDGNLPRRLDYTALAQYMRFQHLLGERTFFEDVTLLPPASVLTFDLVERTCSVRPYWDFDEIPYRPQISLHEAAEEAGMLLRNAVHRLSEGSLRPGVYLSGGLDSRTLLGLIDRRPISSVTYGTRRCRDVHYARAIAKAVGSDHHWFDLGDGAWVLDYVDLHLELTEGYHSWVHAHGLSTLAAARKLMEVNLSGWGGGSVMGHHQSVDSGRISAKPNLEFVPGLFHLFNQRFTWPSLTEAEELLLYPDDLRRKMRGRAFESFSAELAPYLSLRPDIRAGLFFLRNHDARLTQNTITFYRAFIDVRLPFKDYELFDFLYSLPDDLRFNNRLYRSMLQRELPRLARIPYDQDRMLPTANNLHRQAHGIWVRARRRIQRHLWHDFQRLHTLYADYEVYLRGPLRVWAESILYDRRTTDRGLFDPAFVRSLMARHFAAREQWTIGKIAPLITYEMMLRRFVD